MSVQIKIQNDNILVEAPYNTDFIAEARKLNGKWDGATKAWKFDIRDESRVREICLNVYGNDGLAKNLCTLKVIFPNSEYADKGPIEICGRPIARAFGRDSGAKLCEGIVLLNGNFISGGSMKNWITTVNGGTTVLVRDFPKSKAEELISQNPEKYSIQDETPIVNKDELLKEKQRLLDRLAEIENLLK